MDCGKILNNLPVAVISADLNEDRIIELNDCAKKCFAGIDAGSALSSIFGTEGYCAFSKNYENSNGDDIYMLGEKWYIVTVSNVLEYSTIVFTPVTSFVNTSTIKPKNAFDEEFGIYTKSFGKYYLNELVKGLTGDMHKPFTMGYIRLCGERTGDSADKSYVKSFTGVVKNAIRETDVFATMGGSDFIIVFPNCTFDVVGNIISIIEQKLAIHSAAEELDYKYEFDFSIVEVTKENALDGEALLNKAVGLL